MTKNSSFADFLAGKAQDQKRHTPLPPPHLQRLGRPSRCPIPARASKTLAGKCAAPTAGAENPSSPSPPSGPESSTTKKAATPPLHLSQALAQGELARLRQEVQFHGLTTPMPLSLIPACRDLTPSGEMPAKHENLADLAALVLRLAEAGLARRNPPRRKPTRRNLLPRSTLAPRRRERRSRRKNADSHSGAESGKKILHPLYEDAYC